MTIDPETFGIHERLFLAGACLGYVTATSDPERRRVAKGRTDAYRVAGMFETSLRDNPLPEHFDTMDAWRCGLVTGGALAHSRHGIDDPEAFRRAAETVEGYGDRLPVPPDTDKLPVPLVQSVAVFLAGLAAEPGRTAPSAPSPTVH